jgi:hypothetical protein
VAVEIGSDEGWVTVLAIVWRRHFHTFGNLGRQSVKRHDPKVLFFRCKRLSGALLQDDMIL